jgi:phosphoadenosine phosphosulfate reductase
LSSTLPLTTESAVADEVAAAARELEHHSAEDILTVAAARFAPRLALATGFGAEGCVLIDMVARLELPIDIFTLDTGLLFKETYELWGKLEMRYGVRIQGVKPQHTVEEQARRDGDRLWEHEPDRCCAMRKVDPLEAYLSNREAWITAIRRDQTPDRAKARVFEQDRRFGLVKVNPLVRWTHADVEAYVARHEVPVNALHAQGYPSIGCWPCTAAVRPGDDPRSGRWRGRVKTECGLHARPAIQPQYQLIRPEGA